MSVWLEAGWDVDVIGDLKLTVTETTVASAKITVTVASGTFCHTDLSSVVSDSGYTDIASKLKSVLDSESSSSGLGLTYSFSWDDANAQYMVTVSPGTARLAFTATSTAGTRVRNILGFHENQATASSHTSTNTPYYYLSSAMGAKSQDSDDYEPDEIVSEVEVDDGTAGSMAPTAAPTYNDFTITFESRQKTIKRAADADTVSGGTPWTFRHFIEHVRADEPFLVQDANRSPTEQTVHKMRARAARAQAELVVEDWDGAWNWNFETRVLGRL